jgi:hypothetical protein
MSPTTERIGADLLAAVEAELLQVLLSRQGLRESLEGTLSLGMRRATANAHAGYEEDAARLAQRWLRVRRALR